MKALDNFNNSLQEIYDYFGYKEPYRVFSIDDRTDYFWNIQNNQVFFVKDKNNMIWDKDNTEWYYPDDCDDDFYCDEFYYVNSVPEKEKKKNIYEGDDYTLIVVDTRTDGNSFLAIYDNSKKILKK